MLKKYLSLALFFSFLFNTITAQTVAIPDPNFEQALIDLGIDSDGIINQSILQSDAASVFGGLDVSSRNISDLTGIRAFYNMEGSFNCSNNKITNFSGYDIPSPNVRTFNIRGNLITTLTIESSERAHKLNSIDVSNNPNLTYLKLTIDWLRPTTVNASQNPVLKTITAIGNYITSIDISSCPALEELNLAGNELTNIDLSSHTKLTTLNVIQNHLTSLDVRNGNNALITSFNAYNNYNLSCIFVDNAIQANSYNNWQKDENTSYRTYSCNDFGVEISVDKLTIAENGEVAIITATLNAVSPTNEEVSVNLSLSGTAPSSNYELSSSIIVIPAGELSASVTITAVENAMDADKTVIIDISSVENADILTPQQLTFTINHINDAPTDITLQTASFEENSILNDMTIINVSDIDDTTNTISLVLGTGSDDNASFTITDNVLSTNLVFDYETKKDYLIRIKAEDAEGLVIEKALVISVINLNDIVISGTVVNTYCGTDTIGAIQTIITEYISPLAFSWSSGETTQNISSKQSGIYTLTVTDGDGMVLAKDFEIEIEPIYNNLNICYVTSDAIDSDYNRLFINNTGGYNIDKVEVFREGSVFGQYDLIGEMNPNEASYLDNTSNNQTVSYNYKVKIKDKCGNISESSALHRSMLLQANKASDGSINLNWSPYTGLSYGTYNIYRKENNNEFQLLTSLSSSNLAYNDKDVNSNTKSYDYFIGITINNPCHFTPFAKTSKSSLADNIIKSNFKNFSASLGTNDELLAQSISLYPNPVNDVLTINSGIPLSKIEIYSLLGRKVRVVNSDFTSININNLSKGIYMIKIYSEKGIATKKIIKK